MVCLKVFGQPASTDVARVLTCLFEKNKEFQLVRTDTFKGDHKVPEFLKLQDPSGQVTFTDAGVTLVDSREICKHICTKYEDEGNRDLFGMGVLERASIEQWLQSEAITFEPLSSALVFHLAFAEPLGIRPDQSVIQRNETKLSKVLDIYERRLGENEYLAGDEFTLADLSHLPNSHYLVTKSERGRKLFTSRKNVNRWWRAISGRLSWKQDQLYGSKFITCLMLDSREICRHIAEKYQEQGNRDLIGTGTLERASIEQWLQTEAYSFDPPASALVFNLAFAPLMDIEKDEELVERSKKKLTKVLDIYEQKLAETRYLAGDKFTLADLSHLPNAHRLVSNAGCRSLFTSRKRVNRWWEDISNRASWRKVVGMQQEAPPMI